MDELEDLGTYDGDTVHDMWVDYTREQYSDEPIYDEPDPDDFDAWD